MNYDYIIGVPIHLMRMSANNNHLSREYVKTRDK